ncbi:MAG: sugar phosphate isomerase/epimerase [Planctomycetota bacterium]|nr:MAG: sugar phosphate isomerase/epimerase [Planctomycetota bacterium]REK37398.1 MAG: sugar phosphate isomerase/epimerase [Planctomycetota bacterium]
MKYGGHIFLWTDRWSNEQLDLFDRARRLGLDFLELAVGDDIEFDAVAVRRRAESLEMDVVLSPGGDWPMEADLSHDDAECRVLGLDWHRNWLERAADAGAVAYTGAIYGHPGCVQRRLPPPDELPRAAENLGRLADRAAELGIVIAIEPMSHFRTHLVNTVAQARRLLDLAERPALRLLLDTYHLVTEIRDYATAIREAGDRLWGVHACENDRGVPGGGLVPWPTIFETLREVEFDGYLGFETYNSSLSDFAPRRGMFHNVCPDGDTFVNEALSFVRTGLAAS